MSTVAEIRAHRPREVGLARVLVIAAAVLWAPVSGHIVQPTWLAAVPLVLFVFGAFGVVKGRKAGRVMTTVTAAVLYVELLPYCWLGFRDTFPTGPEYAVIDIVAVLLSVAALTLMYVPNSSRYINLVERARRTEQS